MWALVTSRDGVRLRTQIQARTQTQAIMARDELARFALTKPARSLKAYGYEKVPRSKQKE